ncbi:unnamed protein product [Penicillium salamii]|nr:unnamed protein product [Penicillium salamii]
MASRPSTSSLDSIGSSLSGAPDTTTPTLPLTTIFTPALECLTDFWVFQSSWSGNTSPTHWANLGPENTSLCLPSGWTPSTWYSPGIACPSGWTMASERKVVNEETTATCCPIHQTSGLTFTPRSSTSGGARPWHSVEACAFRATTSMKFIRTQTHTSGTTASEFGTATSGIDGWNAYGIELRWKATDLVSASATIPPSAGSATPTTDESSTEHSDGLAPGAKAGIGIGAAIVGALAILGVGFLLYKRKRRASHPELLEQKRQYELDATKNQKHELGANPVHEADGSQTLSKQSRVPAELEGQ